MRQLLTAADIAARLGVAPEWLRRRLGRLYRAGLPRPLPLPGVKRWDPAALDLWLDRFLAPSAGGTPSRPAVLHQPANDVGEEDPEAARWAAILDRRAAALGSGE